MSIGKSKGQRNQLVGAFIAVIVMFSMLLIFSERISSKPTEAGFWIVLVFGVSLGVAITLIMTQVVTKKK